VSKKSRKKRIRDKSTRTQTSSKGRSSIGYKQRRLKSKGEFQPDYSYVIEDLKRIGILAGSFVILLIVLSLFLR
jgi:hypothetical protein